MSERVRKRLEDRVVVVMRGMASCVRERVEKWKKKERVRRRGRKEEVKARERCEKKIGDGK
jgi:hypothetical protein